MDICTNGIFVVSLTCTEEHKSAIANRKNHYKMTIYAYANVAAWSFASTSVRRNEDQSCC
ncbi:hypothetical protein BH11BAC6_BH11BAC6_17050 [soil metagenome]